MIGIKAADAKEGKVDGFVDGDAWLAKVLRHLARAYLDVHRARARVLANAPRRHRRPWRRRRLGWRGRWWVRAGVRRPWRQRRRFGGWFGRRWRRRQARRRFGVGQCGRRWGEWRRWRHPRRFLVEIDAEAHVPGEARGARRPVSLEITVGPADELCLRIDGSKAPNEELGAVRLRRQSDPKGQLRRGGVGLAIVLVGEDVIRRARGVCIPEVVLVAVDDQVVARRAWRGRFRRRRWIRWRYGIRRRRRGRRRGWCRITEKATLADQLFLFRKSAFAFRAGRDAATVEATGAIQFVTRAVVDACVSISITLTTSFRYYADGRS